MNKVSALLYFLLLLTVYFSSKLVLTVLGFTYPMVFQGWQTLVGFVVFKVLQVGKVIPVASIPLDRAGCISLLPNFLFFTAGIIAGSKALAYIPLYIFLAVSNTLPAAIFFFDNVLFPKKTSEATTSGDYTKLQICGAGIVIVTGIVILVLEPVLQFYTSPYFWLVVHIMCQAGHSLHGRIADARFNSVDRQYYSYIFSLVLLAPASLYLNEAFDALHYKELYQIMFIVGSAVSAVSGVCLHLYTSRLRSDHNFGRVHHLSVAATAVLSMAAFELSHARVASLVCAVVNLLALLVVPTHIAPEEEKIQGANTNAVLEEI